MLRETCPTRSNPPSKSNYRDYKQVLRSDFNECCGYCSTPDYMLGGIRSFQIDHFAPKDKFPDRITLYTNLVYTCSFCNRAKWDTWIGDDPDMPNDGIEGFEDPCSNLYEMHIDRGHDGCFVPITAVGCFMIRELKLGLIRHRYIWQSQSIKKLRTRLRTLRDDPRLSDEKKLQLLIAIDDLTEKYESYKHKAIE